MAEWQVVWVPDSGRWGVLPDEDVLGVRDLPAAVARIGLRPGDPVFVGPDGTVDAGLLEFVLSDSFRRLERETKRNYATDIRPLLTFLSSRGVSWRRASPRDLADYRDWRCRAVENPQRIGGTKWNREAAAFTKLFRWAGVEPLPVDVGRREDRAADSVSSNVLWLTPRTWRLWSDIGLRGHLGPGLPAAGWESRTELRNTSFVQLLLGSGLRRQEGGSLLTFEVPVERLRHGRYCHGQIAAAVTRAKVGRVFYATVDAVGQVEAYIASERAWAVQRAQQQGRYERLAGLRLVTGVRRGRRPVVEWVDRHGVAGRQELGCLGWRERQLLFVDGPDGPEPAWLWLTEQGLPMAPERWNGVFRQANQRCEQVLLTARERTVGRGLRLAEVRGRSPYATPLAARHSYALYMLVLLNTLLESRLGLTKADRRDFAMLFGDPWWLVKTLLGHADVETTKRHYLAPVAHLELESVLTAGRADTAGVLPAEDLDGVFACLARESQGIQDIDILLAGRADG